MLSLVSLERFGCMEKKLLIQSDSVFMLRQGKYLLY
jgi:hypothetical protein